MKSKTLLLFCVILMFNCSCRTIRVHCPDGTTAIVQKNPEKQYPVFAKSSQTDVKAAIDVLGKVKIEGLDFSTKTQISELRNKLDGFTTQFDIIAKSSYLVYNTTPCDPDVRKAHFKVLADLTAIQKFKVETDKLVSSGNATGNIDDARLKALINELTKTSNEKGTGFKNN